MAYQNFFATKLFTDIGAGDNTITLETAPTATSGRMVLEARNPTQREIIKYTGVSGNQLTGVLRGQGGTTAKSHLKNALVEMNATSEDLQDLYDAFATFAATNGSGWLTTTGTPIVVSSDGMRSFTLKYTGVDKTAILKKGMKVAIPRTTTVPTQSAKFVAASTQYATKASPTGINFTGNWAFECWAYIDAHTGQMMFLNRENVSAQGWGIRVTPNRQIEWYYGNGTAYTIFRSTAEAPAGRPFHLAVSVDDAVNKFGSVYFDGISAGAVATVTSAAAVSQAASTSLFMGTHATNPSGYLMNGWMSNARLWSTARTQQQFQDNMFKEITTAANLVGSWLLNGNWNDSSGNANHLTPTGGAIATWAANPFNATEYGIIATDPVFSGGDTTFKLFTGYKGGIPNETLGTMSYSTGRAPAGFPVEKYLWRIERVFLGGMNYGVANAATYYTFPLYSIYLPLGSWRLGMSVGQFRFGGSTTAGAVAGYIGMTKQTGNFTGIPTDEVMISNMFYNYNNGQSVQSTYPVFKEMPYTATAPQQWNMYGRTGEAAGGFFFEWTYTTLYADFDLL